MHGSARLRGRSAALKTGELASISWPRPSLQYITICFCASSLIAPKGGTRSLSGRAFVPSPVPGWSPWSGDAGQPWAPDICAASRGEIHTKTPHASCANCPTSSRRRSTISNAARPHSNRSRGGEGLRNVEALHTSGAMAPRLVVPPWPESGSTRK